MEQHIKENTIPFTIADLRKAIPSHCFKPSLSLSIYYFFKDYTMIVGLVLLALYVNSWYFWPFYWFLQGTMFWALFVVGHECGHGSFSRNSKINHFFGHLAHTILFVPYHGWRISHHRHHLNTGHADNEEAWNPLTLVQYNDLRLSIKIIRFHLFFFAFPIYLCLRTIGKFGSHFLPSSSLFQPSERQQVLTSSICCATMALTLLTCGYFYGWGLVANLYVGPYLIFISYLDIVTYLHHTAPEVPWYRHTKWSFLLGNLSTMDRHYGILEPIHHDIGTHIVHHLFMNIPHYHLKEATEAIKPILGSYYRKSNESIFKALWRSYKNCHVIPEKGDKIYYQPLPDSLNKPCFGGIEKKGEV
jgi:omega-3 fatty acid desaturase (delta-15 desaturase)